MPFSPLKLLCATTYLASLASAYNYSYFFNHTGGNLGSNVANISNGCYLAIIADIPACDGYFRWIAQSDYYGPLGNTSYQNQICNTSCLTGYNTYRSNVVSACKNDPQPLPGLPATYWVDATSSAFNQTCQKDAATGQYCTDYIATFNLTNDNPSSLNQSQVCSSCVINLFRHMQSTSYSNYNPALASDWSSIQSRCSVSYPTATPSSVTNASLPGNFAADGSGRTGCLTGNTYTVVSGDGCQAIAVKQSVSFGALVIINNIFPDCSNLIAGASLCIPPKCTAYVVKSGDTCLGIANSTGISFQQLVAWNPALNNYCTNLIAGQNICVSTPGGAVNLTTIAGATVTKTGIYATTTAAPPNPIASGTTRNCGKYYQVQSGDYCQLVALNQSIALDLFEQTNPSINAGCTNLLAGQYYCVLPAAGWNSTSSTTVTPSAPTPSGTTNQCYQYYTIQSGDTCALVQNNFGITFAQLRTWNPSIDTNCANLYLGDAYCVNGATSSTTATAVAATSSLQSSVSSLSSKSISSSGSVSKISTSSVSSSASKPTTSSILGTTTKTTTSSTSRTSTSAVSATSKASSTVAKRNEKTEKAEYNVDGGGVPVGWPYVNAPRVLASRAALP